MNFAAIFRLPSSIAGMVALVAAVAVAACGGGGGGGSANNGGGNCARVALSYGGGGGGGGSGNGSCASPTPSAPPNTQAVGLMLFSTAESPVTVTTYGQVLGYHVGLTTPHAPSDSNVVNLTANGNVQFTNLEAAATPHTASSLGSFSNPFPGFPGSGPGPGALTATAQGQSIGVAGFSTGSLNPGQASSVYSSGGPAMYIFGCYYHYSLDNMRTIVIVM